MHAEAKDFGTLHLLADEARTVDAIQFGHENVLDDHIGLPLAQWFDGLASGAGLGDDFKMWLGVNEQTVFFARDRVVVSQ